ncbi:hypothetical protein ACWOFR_14220 [Carnobacterium gallinarum]|uniref:hypothetical protein n=1 Tax=Carnobacterium gallinarum TaxID=2749 RepID=UPI000555D44C|nr:hypothetical protein [Carnobacterium gallinarum]
MTDKKTFIDVLKNLLNAGEGNESKNVVGQHIVNQLINQKMKHLNERDAKERNHQKIKVSRPRK